MKKNPESKNAIKTNITLNDYFRRLSGWYLMLFIVLPLAYIFLIVFNFGVIYKVTSENIEYKAETTLLQYSVELEDFFSPALSVMESMSYNVEDMFRTNASNESIEQYLIRETETMEEMENINSNGIYGVIKGDYLDGSRWIPDENFVPMERPWYKEAVKNGGKLTYVEPYTDSMTGDRVMSISRLLSDGESVIGIDIKMDEVQAITESLVKEEDDTSQVIVIDDTGLVIAHSDPEEVGKNYLKTKEGYGNTIANKLFIEKLDEFSIRYDNSNCVVYSRELGGGWYMLSVTSQRKMFSNIFRAFGNSVVIGILGTILILYALITITRKRIETENFNIDLKSASAIYQCMYKVDLDEDYFVEISCRSDRISDLVGERRSGGRELIQNVVSHRSDIRTRGDILAFTDLSTIRERMVKTDTITCEFLNPENVWNRARFIVAERNSDDTIKSVLFMVEIIDEEKRSRDRLLYLSETDRMTGINNRGSGENKVRNLLLNGEGGMLLLIDVDRFKSINDTYGHDVGDKVLIAIADSMKTAFRNNDVVMRLGGDEFAVFAPMVFSRNGGELIVRRFLKLIEGIVIEDHNDLKVEVSIGIAFYRPDDTFTFEELYKRADRCIYESKWQSGNRVTYYDSMEAI